MFFVIILFLSVKIGLMVSFGTVGNLGSILTLGIVPMLLSYIVYLLVGSPVLWLLGYFFKVTMLTSMVSSIFVALIVLIPFSLGVVDYFSDYNNYMFNFFTLIGLLLSVVVYAVAFFLLSKKSRGRDKLCLFNSFP